MKTLAPGIEVNGIKITPDEINSEVQYHPAESLLSAKYEAMRALVIREILIQHASQLGICPREEAIKKPDEVIELLLEEEVRVPEADEEACKRYYENNKKKFFTSPLFEVSHILFLAPPEDEEARTKARSKAERVLAQIKENPGRFETLAQEHSACSSGAQGGRLGQISRGQTMPAFEKVLFSMKEGEMSAAPVATEVGYHIIKVHKCADGMQLPYEGVSEWIAKELHDKSWRRAFHQYVQVLAGRCKISGFRFEGVATPLVQ